MRGRWVRGRKGEENGGRVARPVRSVRIRSQCDGVEDLLNIVLFDTCQQCLLRRGIVG